jgi:hypothetical protein
MRSNSVKNCPSRIFFIVGAYRGGVPSAEGSSVSSNFSFTWCVVAVQVIGEFVTSSFVRPFSSPVHSKSTAQCFPPTGNLNGSSPSHSLAYRHVLTRSGRFCFFTAETRENIIRGRYPLPRRPGWPEFSKRNVLVFQTLEAGWRPVIFGLECESRDVPGLNCMGVSSFVHPGN